MSESETARSLPDGSPDFANSAESKPPIRLVIYNLLLLGMTEFILVFGVPVFAAMFADFGAQLPTPTQVLIDWTDYSKQYGCMDPLRALFFAGIAIGAFKGVAPRTWLKLLLVGQTLLLAALIICLFLPIFQLGAVAEGIK
jgi:hypothetical protein